MASQDDAQAKTYTVRVYRITGVTSEGVASVKDDDDYDSYTVTAHDSVLAGIAQLFDSQSDLGELRNWHVRALNKVAGRAQRIDLESPACLHPNLIMFRRGG